MDLGIYTATIVFAASQHSSFKGEMETTNETICSKCCTAVISGQPYTICQGFCTDAYHADCVNLTDADVMSFNRNRCIWWLCVSCTNMMCNIRNDKSLLSKRSSFALQREQTVKSVPPLEADMKNDILEMKKEIAIIQRTLADHSNVHGSASINESTPLARSSPKCDKTLMFGSKCSSTNVSTSSSSTTQEKFWLFFTRLKNTVNEDQMLRMVSTAIGSNNVTVRKLVACWKDISTLPYVSFKIGIDPEFKNVAMLSSTWPTGVCYREFHNNYELWEP